jgi:hypothetical protein
MRGLIDMSSFRVRAAAVVAALGLLVVGASAATAGPGSAPSPSGGISAQPPLSKESAELAAKALAQGAGTQLVPSAVTAAVPAAGGLCAGQGFGVTAATRLFTGVYEVFFNQVITSGVYTATIGQCGNLAVNSPGMIGVVGRAGTTNGLFIQTFNAAGAPADLGFHVNVLF